MDGNIAQPGWVKMCSAYQSQMAKFGGILEACEDSLTVDTDGDGIPDAVDGIITIDECTWTLEELELVRNSMNANAFNFYALNLDVLEHFVEVRTRITSDSSFEQGGASASASASIGKVSLNVDEVKYVKSADLTSTP